MLRKFPTNNLNNEEAEKTYLDV